MFPQGWLWFNSCANGGDDVPEGEPIPDPELPEYNPNWSCHKTAWSEGWVQYIQTDIGIYSTFFYL